VFLFSNNDVHEIVLNYDELHSYWDENDDTELTSLEKINRFDEFFSRVDEPTIIFSNDQWNTTKVDDYIKVANEYIEAIHKRDTTHAKTEKSRERYYKSRLFQEKLDKFKQESVIPNYMTCTHIDDLAFHRNYTYNYSLDDIPEDMIHVEKIKLLMVKKISYISDKKMY
jgi:hypothetical protein